MKKRSEKQEDLDKLKGELAKVSTVILSTFQGITVEDDNKLRRAVKQAGGHYQVVKNTLAERAGAGTPNEALLKNLSGTNSIAYTETDPVSLAKALTKIAKDVPAFQFRAEAYNIINRGIFGQPGSNISTPTSVGKVSTTSADNRSIQLAIKGTF